MTITDHQADCSCDACLFEPAIVPSANGVEVEPIEPEQPSVPEPASGGLHPLAETRLAQLRKDIQSVHQGLTSRGVHDLKPLLQLADALLVGDDRRAQVVLDEGIPDGASSSGWLNLPDEFWSARPLFEHVRDAARARILSPDAVLAAVLARFAATVPKGVVIPPIVGDIATFDFLACVVADSGGGKSAAMGVAAELLPLSREDYPLLRIDQNLGTGEGLAEAFFEKHKDEADKRVWVKYQHYDAVHFSADEGSGILALGGRAGATLIQNLCSGWSGKSLGQLNASADSQRHLDARSYRIAGLMALQTKYAHEFIFGSDVAATGLAKRFLFMHGLDPLAPEELPVWPGPVDIKIIQAPANEMMVYDHAIAQEVRSRRKDFNSGRVQFDPLDGHRDLLTEKLAGLFALADFRYEVTLDDWALAQTMVQVSRRVRSYLREKNAQELRQAREQAAHVDAERQLTTEGITQGKRIERVRTNILKRLEKMDQPTIAVSQARKSFTSGDDRQVFHNALDELVAFGFVVREGNQIRPKAAK